MVDGLLSLRALFRRQVEQVWMNENEPIPRRTRSIAKVMHEFNDAIATDNDVEVLLLPGSDGVSIIRFL